MVLVNMYIGAVGGSITKKVRDPHPINRLEDLQSHKVATWKPYALFLQTKFNFTDVVGLEW
jgi:hypothetical protein